MLGKSAVLMGALLAAAIGPAAAADSTWKSHQDRNCGIALKSPPAYTLKASGAPDFCVLSMDIGVPAGTKLRTLYTLETRDMESVERTELAKTGKPPSARDFALHVATIQCGADGPDGSRYCENGQVRSTFKTAQGFHGFEIHLTEVYETVSPKKTEKRKRGPVFALDLSDDETVRVLMASAAPKHDGAAGDPRHAPGMDPRAAADAAGGRALAVPRIAPGVCRPGGRTPDARSAAAGHDSAAAEPRHELAPVRPAGAAARP